MASSNYLHLVVVLRKKNAAQTMLDATNAVVV